MQKKIQHSILRNPIYILGCYSILLLPEFINSCSHKAIVTSFWNNIPLCSKEFVFAQFLGNSIWSILLLVFVFESFKIASRYFKITSFPTKIKEWLLFELKLVLSSVIAFLSYLLIAYIFAWFNKSIEEIDPFSIFYKAMVVAFVGVHGIIFLSHLKFVKNPLIQKIDVEGPLGKMPITVNEIVYFEKIERYYYVNSADVSYKINYNLSDIEKMLDKAHFFRINRTVIVNVEAVESYSRWENEKYIVTLINKKELVATRKRIVELKDLIKNLKKRIDLY
ncbi:LytTr DNA-binding domain-containing protein [Aquimarina sp. MAR_2010_214]|uniref:LytTR family DNA-binding domain-containing protein n=1 Tax=Aquimarina sp. MAR_2010_214 TaxID=1250026 RepID=UPI000C712BE5|nr:LytTR family DNA-binding domain-containing protein [Aquimarina sp. MAR_2010_214]PKV49699.1 LytTr DNA-binding domain-containing protein [Aquimarina sp. MAR_2010_214]